MGNLRKRNGEAGGKMRRKEWAREGGFALALRYRMLA